MNEADVIKMIRKVVRQEIASTMMCTITSTADQNRSSIQRFATEGVSDNLRSILPYGFVSRAPAGTDAVLTPINADPTHLAVLGQFDSGRPSVQSGETALYGPGGQQVYLNSAGHVLLGSQGASSPEVLGDVLKEGLTQIISQLNTLISNLSTGPVGVLSGITPGSPVPTNPALVTSLAQITIALSQIQSQFIDTASTNILSQKVFTTR